MPHTARHGGSDDDGDGGSSDPGSITRDRGGAGAGGGGEPTVGVGEEPPAPDDAGGGLQSGDEILGDPIDVGSGPSDTTGSGGSSGGGGGGGGGSSGGGGGGGGSTTSPTRTVSGSTTLGANTTTVSTAVSETQATAPDLGDTVPAAVDSVGAGIADFREFQRETTPVQDAGRQTRGFLSNQTGIDIASERQAADRTNEIIGSQLGTSPREVRLGLRRGALDTIGSGVDTAVDAVPGDERGVAAGATALAVAEPTPFGEAALLGGSALAGIGGSTATNPEQGSDEVPDSPFVRGEIDAPSEPGSDGELPQPADPNPGGDGEISQPSDPRPGVGSELDISPTEGDDAAIQAGQGVLIDEERGDGTTISREDIVGERGDVEQDPPATRERQRRDDLDVFERDFPGRERQVIGRDGGGGDGLVSDDVPGQGTDVTTGTTAGVGFESGAGGGSPLPPLAGGTDPELDVTADAFDTIGTDDITGPDIDDGTDTGGTSGTITGTTQGIGPAEQTGTGDGTGTSDTDTDTTQRNRNRTRTATTTLSGSATIEGAADATAPDFGEPSATQDVEPNVRAAPGTSTTGQRPRRPRRPRGVDFDIGVDDADDPALVTEGDTVTNPTRSLSAVDKDLQDVFGGGDAL